MKIVYSRFIPFRGFLMVNLFGILVVRKNRDGSCPKVSDRAVRHESIHTEQMKEMLYVFFYVWYFLEWIFRLILPPYETAYRDISLEEEAKGNENDPDYLKHRKRYSWIHYLK